MFNLTVTQLFLWMPEEYEEECLQPTALVMYKVSTPLTGEGTDFTFAGNDSSHEDISLPAGAMSVLIKNRPGSPVLIDSLSLLDGAGDFYFYPSNMISKEFMFIFNMQGDPDGATAALGMYSNGVISDGYVQFDVRDTLLYTDTATLRLKFASSTTWGEMLPPDTVMHNVFNDYYVSQRSGGSIVEKRFYKSSVYKWRYVYNYNGSGKSTGYEVYDQDGIHQNSIVF